MATLKPRVQVLLNDDTKAVFDRLAGLFGISTSRMIASVLDDLAPQMIKVADIMQQAKDSAEPLKMLESAKAFAVDSRQVIANEQLHLEDLIAASKTKTKAKAKPKA